LSLKRLVAGRLGFRTQGRPFACQVPALPALTSGAASFHLGAAMIEVTLEESDRLDWALKTFKKKVLKAGILKDLRRKRHYVKPSEARQLKMAAARRRGRPSRPNR
jgi:small subunit ribosomal protein S21